MATPSLETDAGIAQRRRGFCAITRFVLRRAAFGSMAMRSVVMDLLSEQSSTSQNSVMTPITTTEMDVRHTARKNVVTIARAARECERIRVTPVVVILSAPAPKHVTMATRMREMAVALRVA